MKITFPFKFNNSLTNLNLTLSIIKSDAPISITLEEDSLLYNYPDNSEKKFSLVNDSTKMVLGEETGRVYEAFFGKCAQEIFSMLDYMEVRSKLLPQSDRFLKNLLAGKVILSRCFKEINKSKLLI